MPIAVRLEMACKLLDVPTRTFRDWISEGSGPKGFKKGKNWYFPVKLLEEWAIDQAEKQCY